MPIIATAPAIKLVFVPLCSLNLSAQFNRHGTVFFSHNKLASAALSATLHCKISFIIKKFHGPGIVTLYTQQAHIIITYKISLGFVSSSTLEQPRTSTTQTHLNAVGGQNPGILIPPIVQIRASKQDSHLPPLLSIHIPRIR